MRATLIILLVFSSSLNATAKKKLSANEFITLATKFDASAESIVSEKMRLRFMVEQGLPTSQTLLTVQQEYGLSTTGAGTTSILSAGISKNIITSGTQLSLTRTMTDRPDREEEVTELRVEQSLWRNSLGSTNLEREKGLIAERDALELQVAESYEDYIYERLSEYIDLQRAMLERETSKRQLDQAIALEKNVLERQRQSIASNADVARAKVQTLNRREALLLNQSEFDNLSARLAAYTGEKAEAYVEPVNFDLSNRVADILNGKVEYTPERLLRLVELREQAAEATLSYQKDELRPEANLLLGYNIDDSDRFSSRVNREEAVVGITVEVPFGDSAGKANRDSAILDLTQARLTAREQRLELTLSLASSKRELARLNQMLDIAKQKVRFTDTIVTEEQKRYRLGKISLEALIEAQDDQAAAQVSLLESKAELNRAILDWLRLNDQLLVRDAVAILAN